MKRVIAFLLCVLMIVTLASCAKKEELGTTPDARKEQSEKDESSNMYNFLVLGHDREANLTDVMMLVSLNTKDGTAAITQLPRDTYFEVDDYSYHKINGLYNHFIKEAREDDADDPELEGCIRTAKYLSENLDIKIHYSAVMDLDGFASIVDAIGGVYMYVPYNMYYNDPGQNLHINLNKGFQTLDGDAAEQFVRFRSGFVEADLGRQDSQKMFMTAFIEAAKENVSLSNIDDIVKAVFDNLKTDMSLAEMVKFATAALKLELEGINMVSLPGSAVYSNGAWYYVMYKEAVATLMQKYYNVYEEKITVESFDKDKVFCNEEDSEMYDLYNTEYEEGQIVEHNAQDMSDEDIDIALK